nr:hypothetical protein GCM10020063_021000 [Dactylosporangium thailandense]
MRTVTESELGHVLGALPGVPRIVASGNFAAPHRLLAAADTSIAEFRLVMLNAQPGIPDRDGVVHETSFVGHSYIVTEQGTARIWGRDPVEQAQEILDHAAHPAVHDSPLDAGRRLGLPPRRALRTSPGPGTASARRRRSPRGG